MGVSEMTYVSYFLTAMAVLSGCVSIVMYFTFDIRRCWRIVQGIHSSAAREKAPFAIVSIPAISNAGEKENILIHEKTEKLTPEKTEMLFSFEETGPLETMTLLQDIVMMTDAGKECQSLSVIGNCVNP